MSRFQLYYTPTSPFARKVRVVAIEAGLGDEIETVRVRPTPGQNEPALQAHNPLAKVPTLIGEGCPALYDSPVICEYLDSLHDGPKLIPAAGSARWRVLRLQALADGVLDASILHYYEMQQRPVEKHFALWLDMQRGKALSGLDELEREAAHFDRSPGAPIDLGQIAAGALLGWMEFRDALGDVRTGRPALFDWYESFRQRESMRATEPHL